MLKQVLCNKFKKKKNQLKKRKKEDEEEEKWGTLLLDEASLHE